MTARDPCEPPVPLREVVRKERELMKARRAAVPDLSPGAPVAGLALSGGGIRSATFCLGFLQSLARGRLLERFDYLSTVSGGGYVGGWWMAWLARRDAKREAARVAQRLPPDLFPPPERTDVARNGDTQAGAASAGNDPIRFLRLFSNYLTPRKGAFSADTWRVVAVVSRNLVLTWLTLLPVLFAAICLVQAPLAMQSPDASIDFIHSASWSDRWKVVGPAVGLLGKIAAGILVFTTVGWMIAVAKFGGMAEIGSERGKVRFGRIVAASVGQGLFLGIGLMHPVVAEFFGWSFGTANLRTRSMPLTWGVPALLLLAIYSTLNLVEWFDDRKASARGWLVRLHARTLLVSVVAAAAIALGGFGDLAWKSTVLATDSALRQAGGFAGIAAAIGAAVFRVLRAGSASEKEGGAAKSSLSRAIMWVAPFLVVTVLALCTSWLAREALRGVHTGLDGEEASLSPPSYTWVMDATLAGSALCLMMALYEVRRRAVLLTAVMLAVSWFVRPRPHAVVPAWTVLALAFFAALVTAARVDLAARAATRTSLPTRRPLLAWGAAAGAAVLVLGVAFLVAGRGALFEPVRGSRIEHACNATVLLVFATVVLAACMWLGHTTRVAIGLVACSAAASFAMAAFNLFPAEWAWDAAALVGLGGTALTASLGLGWMIDPNPLSLHGLYRERIVRAYLGASNRYRGDNGIDVTDAVHGDDLPLSAAYDPARGAPYPILNTTLNLVAARDLGVIQRRSASFVFTPAHCGSTRTGFRCTDEYMSGAMLLGTAVAISGAAASPAMGTLRLTAAQAMLFTLLNVRLGFWAPNPAFPSWRAPQPRLWTLQTLREFLSQTGETSSYCYLSDGGHFENTGLYSLVERACEKIVVVDCGQDPWPPAFGDLGHAIRLCRIDFGAEISLDVEKLAAPQAFTSGTVIYAPEHLSRLGLPPERREGKILWIKPSLWKQPSIPADVRQYAATNPRFPQQSTADQWFDEAQFESYRKLGECAGEAAHADLTKLLAPVVALTGMAQAATAGQLPPAQPVQPSAVTAAPATDEHPPPPRH